MFEESQRFNQWWLWTFLIGLQLTTIVLFATGVIYDSDDPVPGIVLLLLPDIPITMFILFRLDTRISEIGVHFYFVPFVSKTYTWEEIESCEVLDYGFVGGWGIRLWTRFGTVYNIKGSKGVFIKLKDGKQFLIGTQKPQEVEQAIANFK